MKKSHQRLTAEQINAALQDALNQPGIRTAMEISELADKQAMAASQYEAYLVWQRIPVITNSCSTTTIA